MQVKQSLRKLIVSGVLAPDEKLQSVRELAAELAINPNTIQRAYRELEAEGYIYSVAGKGSFAGRPPEVDENRRKKLLAVFESTAAELLYLGVNKAEMQRIIEDKAGEADA